MSEVLDHAKLEGAVVQAIKDWATANPGDLVEFDRHMKQVRDLQRNRGISDDMGKFGEVPARLHALMVRRFTNLWHHDVRVRDFFWSHFRVGRMRFGDKLSVKQGERTA